MHSSECQWASVDFAEEDLSISRRSVSLETVQEKRECCNIKKQKQNLKKQKLLDQHHCHKTVAKKEVGLARRLNEHCWSRKRETNDNFSLQVTKTGPLVQKILLCALFPSTGVKFRKRLHVRLKTMRSGPRLRSRSSRLQDEWETETES